MQVTQNNKHTGTASAPEPLEANRHATRLLLSPLPIPVHKEPQELHAVAQALFSTAGRCFPCEHTSIFSLSDRLMNYNDDSVSGYKSSCLLCPHSLSEIPSNMIQAYSQSNLLSRGV